MSVFVRIDGRALRVSDHAIGRYVERVKPHLSLAEARAELALMMRHATIDVLPGWVSAEGYRSAVLLGDGIVFPLKNGRMTTCVTRGSVGAEIRVARNDRRRERQQRQQAKQTEPHSRRAKGHERARRQRRQEKYGGEAA